MGEYTFIIMSFCDHCAGQRFDRAQVLRALRETRRKLRRRRTPYTADDALALAIHTVRSLEIPHLELEEDFMESQVVH